MKNLLLASLLLLQLGSAFASVKSYTGKVKGYIVSKSGTEKLFYFTLEGNPSGGCNTTGRFLITGASTSHDGTQAAIMTAFQSKTDVNVYYDEVCSTGENAWDIRWVCVGNIPC